MKRLVTHLSVLLLMVTSLSALAWDHIETGGADWDSAVFTADTTTPLPPFGLYNLVVGDVITNNSNSDNMDVIVTVENVTPGGPTGGFGPSYKLWIAVEEETTPGDWSVVADSTGQAIITNDQPNERKFIIQKNSTADNGQPFTTLNGFKFFVNEAPSGRMRVRIFFEETTPGGAAALVNATVTGAYRFY